MNKTTLLARLAMAGIASGMLAVSACNKGGKPGEDSGSTGSKPSPAETPAAGAVDSLKSAEQGCKGLNACKGQGGCFVSEADLKAYAAKAGIPLEKAGKPHSCKGLNECKGLGGCKH